jgi:hypothetical protein
MTDQIGTVNIFDGNNLPSDAFKIYCGNCHTHVAWEKQDAFYHGYRFVDAMDPDRIEKTFMLDAGEEQFIFRCHCCKQTIYITNIDPGEGRKIRFSILLTNRDLDQKEFMDQLEKFHAENGETP